MRDLSEFEDKDLSGRIAALEAKRNEYWKGEDLTLRKSADKRAEDEVRDQQKTAELNRELASWQPFENADDGITYLRHYKTGEMRPVAKTSLTTADKLKAAKDQLREELIIKEPYAVNRETADYKRTIDAANIAATSREKIQGMKDVAAKNKAAYEAAQAKFKPGDTPQRIYNDLAEKFATDPALRGELLDDYINCLLYTSPSPRDS